jgi:tetratricopeptide (TPR) repeat protein
MENMSLAQKLPFVNRRAELRQIEEVLRNDAGGPARVGFLYGEGGVGKTKLVSHALALYAGSRLVVNVRCSPAETSMPFRAVLSVVEDLSSRAKEGQYATFQQFLRSLGSGALAQSHSREAIERILFMFPGIGNLAAVFASPMLGTGRFSEDHYLTHHPVQSVVLDYIAYVCGQRSLVVFIDDVQFIDANSLVVLSALAEGAGPGLSILLAYRVGDPKAVHEKEHILDKFSDQALLTAIHTRALTRNEFGFLVKHVVRSEQAEQLIDHFYEATHGDLRGFIDRVHARQLGEDQRASPRRSEVGAIDVVLIERLDALPRGLRQTLAILCAFGPAVRLSTLRRALAHLPYEAEAVDVLSYHLKDLAEKDLVRIYADASGDQRVEAAHPRISEAILQADDTFSRLAHQTWGGFFQDLRAGNRFLEHSRRDVLYRIILHQSRVDPRAALPAVQEALDVALQFQDLPSATSFAQDCARAVVSAGDEASVLRVEVARLFFAIGQFQGALDLVGQLTQSVTTTEEASLNVLRLMAMERIMKGAVAEDCHRSRKELEQAARRNPALREYALAVHLVEITAQITRRDYNAATKLFKRAMEKYADLKESSSYAILLRNSEQVLEPKESLLLIQEAVLRFERLGDAQGAASAKTSVGMQLIQLGRLAEARVVLQQADSILQEKGSYDIGIVWNNQAAIYLLEGRPDLATPRLRQALLLSDYPFSDIVLKVNLATSLRLCGDGEGATRICRDLVRLVPSFPDTYLVLGAGYQTARNLLLLGHRDEAADLFAKVKDATEPWSGWAFWLADLENRLTSGDHRPLQEPPGLEFLFKDRLDHIPLLSFWHFNPPA